ncbi:MAG: acetyl-CoA acetyltransferase [Armatimonadetes bacterium]|nr:acetyl-CoA acetyltransferase [Armatimonadota bacterium]
MPDRVAIVGVGATPLRPITPDLSYREMTFQAATQAYADAGVGPRDVDSFVSVCEDFHEGTSITDEYVPDQLGAVLKPVQTIAGDGLQGVAAAIMLLRSGIADLVAVEAHCKTSNILRQAEVIEMALDPVYERPLRANPHYVAALEMRRFLHEGGVPPEATARVAAANRRAALRNPMAAYGAGLSPEDVAASAPVCLPLRRLEISQPADGAVVLVLASEDAAGGLRARPVWVRGIGFASDTPWLAGRNWARATYAEIATRMAYRMAGIERPRREIDFAEVDDTYAYKQLQHLAALGLDGDGIPVNPSGGSLGMGYCHDATALYRVAEATWQLRGAAGPRQVPRVRTGAVASWRGVPTTTGGVLVLGVD